MTNTPDGSPENTGLDNYWYMYSYPYQGWAWSDSWSVSGDLWQYLYNTGLGSRFYTWSGAAYTSNHSGVYTGDVLFYAWYAGNGDPSINHAAIQVNDDYDERGNWTSVVDEHTSNRYHVNWTLWTNNQNRNTTSIYAIHIW
jgi:hypothetical protein